MTPKPALLSAAAEADVEAIALRYVAESGIDLAIRFAEALDAALAHVGTHPATGSLRYADRAGAPGLRVWPLHRFPHLVFYVEHPDRIDILRVLHGKRDIPTTLVEP